MTNTRAVCDDLLFVTYGCAWRSRSRRMYIAVDSLRTYAQLINHANFSLVISYYLPFLETMNNDRQLYIDKAIRGLNGFKKLVVVLIALVAVTPPAVFYFTTVAETNSFGTLLDAARYASRMHDSFTYAVAMLLFISLCMSFLVWMFLRFANSYVTVINTLSGEDVDRFEKVNKAMTFGMYMPPFIISNGSIILFKALNTRTFILSEVQAIKITGTYVRRRAYFVQMVTDTGTYNYVLANNRSVIQVLMEEVLQVNPKISIDLK